MNAPITFFADDNGDYSELSNLSPYGFTDDAGLVWPSVEHYMYGHKFTNEYREQIRTARSAKKAKLIADAHLGSVRPDWKNVMDEVMLTALRLKFSQPEMRKKLLETGDRDLIYACPFDRYWGAGRREEGKNQVGKLMMQVREEIAITA